MPVRPLLLSLLVLPIAVASASSAASGCTGPKGAIQPRPGGWSTVSWPAFPQHNNLVTQPVSI